MSVVFTPKSRRSKKTGGRIEYINIDASIAAKSTLTADLQLDVDVGSLANRRHNVTQKLVSLTQDGVHQGTDTDKTSRHSELQVVTLGKERYDSGSQRLTDEFSGLVGEDLSRSDLDFLSDLEDSAQNRSSCYTSLQLVNRRTRLVDIEGSNDDQSRVGFKVVLRNRDLGTDVLVDGVDVVLQLSRDGDNGCVSGNGGCKQ